MLAALAPQGFSGANHSAALFFPAGTTAQRKTNGIAQRQKLPAYPAMRSLCKS
jgi:hypothetical protein